MFSEDEPQRVHNGMNVSGLLLGTTASADKVDEAPGGEGSPVYLRSHSN